jgi:hypothetical protein
MAHILEELPVDALIFLLGSRYCETDRLSGFAWSTFSHLPKGWPLVQAICEECVSVSFEQFRTKERARRLWCIS